MPTRRLKDSQTDATMQRINDTTDSEGCHPATYFCTSLNPCETVLFQAAEPLPNHTFAFHATSWRQNLPLLLLLHRTAVAIPQGDVPHPNTKRQHTNGTLLALPDHLSTIQSFNNNAHHHICLTTPRDELAIRQHFGSPSPSLPLSHLLRMHGTPSDPSSEPASGTPVLEYFNTHSTVQFEASNEDFILQWTHHPHQQPATKQNKTRGTQSSALRYSVNWSIGGLAATPVRYESDFVPSYSCFGHSIRALIELQGAPLLRLPFLYAEGRQALVVLPGELLRCHRDEVGRHSRGALMWCMGDICA
ncbi:hypothetical protein TcWFU_003816 [Taenia crassiceps]|uniref:Uncharacterized protein n=1 Tax=Taenia crassiceps TaxID=6207 RepID=A0ABR4PZK1_9CEST